MENFFGILKQEMYDGEPLMIYDQLQKDKQLLDCIIKLATKKVF